MATAKTSGLSHSDYVRFRDFIRRQTGLHFPDNRRADLERGVRDGLGGSGLTAIDEYYDRLAANPSGGLMPDLVNLLTIGETYFNRDQTQWSLLRREVFPKLIQERAATDQTIRIWSAGCSTGEEPYSLAILLHELIPYIETWNVTILATDINRDSLATAKKGRYGNWSFREMPDEWLEKYFFAENQSNFHISELIKKRVSFEYMNLKGNSFPSPLTNTTDLDLIICRNVMIYFDEQTTRDIMDRFHASLTPGGWLLAGASDPIPPRDLFRARNFSGAFIYQKQTPGFESRRRKREEKQSIAPAKTAPAAVKTRRPAAPVKPLKAKPPAAPAEAVSSADALAECGALLEIGQPGLAAEKLTILLDKDPNSTAALLLMVKVETARGDLNGAIECAQKVIQIDKLEISAYYLLSAIYQSLGEDDRAIDYLKKTLYLDPGLAVAHFALGCLYKKHNRSSLAKKAFKNVQRLMLGSLQDEIVPESNGISCKKLLEIVEANLKQE